MPVADPLIFTKHVQKLPLGQLAPALRAIGVTGVDLTVRRGGHVQPERAADDLPRVAETLARGGVSIGMISTDITDAHASHARPVLEAARGLGVTHYKLGYYGYEGFGTLRKARDEVKAKLRDLADLSADVGIHAGFHNHSGAMIGASCWDVDYMLGGTDPRWLGSYFDPVHAVVEGGNRGWLQALDLLAPRITMLGVKDFRWLDTLEHYPATRRNGWILCRLAEGTVPWTEVLRHLRASGFAGPVSFHPGYMPEKGPRELTPQQALEQGRSDIEHFNRWWDQAAAT